MKLTKVEQYELNRYQSLFNFERYLKNKKLLLTGCKGLVGSGILKWILYLNQSKNIGASIIASTRNPEVKPEYIEESDLVEFCKFGEEQYYCRNKRIDYIIHAASPTGNTYHAAHPVESLRVIVDETEKMLELAQVNKDCSFIYLSSEEVYGLPKTDAPIEEGFVGAIDSLNYRSCYPLGKKVAELLCYNYALEYGVDAKIIRPTVIHGLLQPYSEQRVVNEILRCIIENKNLIMKSDGSTKKCLMYTLDAISAVFTVLFKGKKGEAYNASNTDTFMMVRDLAKYIFEKFNPSITVEYAKVDIAVNEGYLPQRTILQSIEKIKKLGWIPHTSLDEIYKIDIARFRKEVL